MPGGARGVIALIAVAAAIVAAVAGDAVAAPATGTCVQPGYSCVPTGRWRESATNPDQRCTWTYNVDWGDGAKSFFVPAPGEEGHADHRYDIAVHHLYKVAIDVPLGISTDPDLRCTGGRYAHRVEIPGPAIVPCVPARRTKPPSCYPLGVASGSPLLDQVPRLGRSTLDFLLLSDIRALRKSTTSDWRAGLIAASYLVPQKRLPVLTDSALTRLGKSTRAKLLAGLLPAEAKLVLKGDRSGVAPSFRSAAAQEALTRALLKEANGDWIGTADGTVRSVVTTTARARDLFRQLTRLGNTAVLQRGGTEVVVSELPNGDRAEFTSAGPSMRYFTAATAAWTSFRFVVVGVR